MCATSRHCGISSADVRQVRRGGFTLVELLMAITLMGLVVGLAVPRIGAVRSTYFAAESAKMLGETGVGVDKSWRLIKGNSHEELAEQLRKDLKADYDVIVLAGINWDIIPLDCQYTILKRVKAESAMLPPHKSEEALPAHEGEAYKAGERQFPLKC